MKHFFAILLGKKKLCDFEFLILLLDFYTCAK